MKRNRRAAVEDLWLKTVRDENGNTATVPSALHGRGSRWRARYVDSDGREHAKQFPIKAQAQRWLDRQTSTIVLGTHVAPALALHHLPGLSAARRARHSAAVWSSPRPTRSALQIEAISPWLGSGSGRLEEASSPWARASSARSRSSAIACSTNLGWVGTAASRSIAACASSKDLRRRRAATVLPPIRRWPGLQDRPVRVRLTGSIAECPGR
jgi:hypothetical protein